MRRFSEQAREVKRAQELDPLSPSMGANLGRAYLNLGDTDAAIKECKRALELNFDLALVHAALANDDEAIAWLEKDFGGAT